MTASYGALTSEIFGEAGYAIDAGPAEIEPFADLTLANVLTAPFSEAGSGGVSGTGASASLGTTALGLRTLATLPVGEMTATVTAMAAWQHRFGATATTADLSFAGGQTFTIAGTPLAVDSAIASLNLDLALSPAANLSLSYDGSLALGGSSQAATAQLRIRF